MWSGPELVLIQSETGWFLLLCKTQRDSAVSLLVEGSLFLTHAQPHACFRRFSAHGVYCWCLVRLKGGRRAQEDFTPCKSPPLCSCLLAAIPSALSGSTFWCSIWTPPQVQPSLSRPCSPRLPPVLPCFTRLLYFGQFSRIRAAQPVRNRFFCQPHPSLTIRIAPNLRRWAGPAEGPPSPPNSLDLKYREQDPLHPTGRLLTQLLHFIVHLHL